MKLRIATPADATTLAEIDRDIWPVALATTEPEFLARTAAFPEGQCVLERDGRIIGRASAQRITAKFLAENSAGYDLITDGNCFTNSHDPAGEIFQLVDVGMLPRFRDRQSGRLLVDRQITLARGLEGVRRILGFTRPAVYHRYAEVPIETYLAMRGVGEKLLDRVVAFHVEAGARIVSVHPGFRPRDEDSRGYGVLIEYPI